MYAVGEFNSAWENNFLNKYFKNTSKFLWLCNGVEFESISSEIVSSFNSKYPIISKLTHFVHKEMTSSTRQQSYLWIGNNNRSFYEFSLLPE